MQILNAETLKAACQAGPTKDCACSLRPCASWESFTEDRWPAAQMTQLGTLRDPDIYEPTTDEHHPNGSRYASPDAPVAIKFFPYNVSDVHACKACSKVVMRYTEFGGYYVDHRVRELDESLIAG